ncbi:MAG: radical SAM/SPASM domain-containing protein [Thermoguttaceae bacterium]
MRIQQILQLVRIFCDRRVTVTPKRVFKQLRTEGKLKGEVRNKLSRGFFQRLSQLRNISQLLEGEHITKHENQWVLNSFLPPFPGPAYDRMFENLLSEKRWNPVSGFIAVTSECPANCWHCSLKKRPGGTLPTETWRDVISQMHNLGVSLFGITGGEPLTRPDLAELVHAIKSGGGEAMIFTSGFGMTPEKANELKTAGLWAVCVSLDRIDPREVNAMRNYDKMFESAVNTLEIAKNAGLYTCVNCVADKNNVESKMYLKLYDKAVSLRVDEFRLIEPMRCGNLLESADSTFLTPDQILELRKFHRDTNKKLNGSSYRRNDAKYPTKVCAFNEMESPELFGCSGGTRHLFIDAAGEVCPCDFTPLSFGNIQNEKLDVIWDRMSTAMKQPRRHCMIQNHYEIIHSFVRDKLPAPVELSLKAAATLPDEELPDFVKWYGQ